MKSLISLSVLATIVLSIFTPVSYADTLIYDNSIDQGGGFSDSMYFTDYGSSSGGVISKFKFDYWTTSSNVGAVWITFYQGTNQDSMGTPIKTFTLTDVPSTGGWVDTYEYVIPQDQRFELAAGDFGYGYKMSSSATYVITASGGQSNEDYFWGWFGSPYNDYYLTYFENGYSGFSMQIYTAPPISATTCDISGYKFNDVDGNGTWDAGEPSIPGWEIYLDLNSNKLFDSATEPSVVTDPNGMYFFENVEFADPNVAETFIIREVMQNGWTQTLPGGPDYEYSIVAEPNNVYGSFDFGNTDQILSASVHGTITHDSNGDSILNPAEPKLAGWTVYVDVNGNTKHDTGEPSAVTNANGEYQLSGLTPGSHIIAELMGEGWVQTYPTAACTHQVTITASDQIIENIDFGNHTFNGYGGGSGTSSDPYLIYNHHHLQAVGAHEWNWDKHFKLMDDIDLSKYNGEQFNMIGQYHWISGGYGSFKGVFDGNGYTVNNFSYNYTGTSQMYVGLFGFLWNAEVRNLRMENVDIDIQEAGVQSAALVGQLGEGALISDCHVSQGAVIVENSGAGGLIGRNSGGTVQGCTVALNSIQGGGDSGGIVSSNYEGTISNCSFEGTLYAPGKMLDEPEILVGYDTGGIAGSNQSTMSQCYANATIDGIGALGGLVGQNYGGVISQCYAQGTVLANSPAEMGLAGSEAGGLVGVNIGGGSILDSFSMTNVTGSKKIGGLVGVSSNSSGICSISNCYAVGFVLGSYTKGGLIGWNTDGLTVVTNCFWDTQTTGLTYSDGGTGLPTEDMQDIQTYLDAGWDFAGEATNGTEDVWKLCDGVSAYPGLTWTDPSICGATTVVLTAIEDTYADESQPDTNFGSANTLYAGLNGSMENISYVRFDISSIPEGQVVASAKLQLYCSYLTAPAPILGVLGCNDYPDENTVTWNDRPLTSATTFIGETVNPQTVTSGVMEWDVTELIDKDYFPYYRGGLSSIAILQDYSNPSGARAGFWSKDVGVSDWAPKLIVQYKPAFGGGAGTPDDPFQIWTAEQMNEIGLYSNRWRESFQLMADISMADYTGSSYNSIGDYSANPRVGFGGVFDGNGHTISDFQGPALFGYVSWGRIQELGLIAPVVTDDGALVNRLDWGQIAECWVEDGSVNGGSSVGGLIGSVIYSSSIGGCWSSADVSGSTSVGGLVGYAGSFSQFENCSATGSVSGQDNVGGFIGSGYDNIFLRCYSSGQVSGTTAVGGFCGDAEYVYQDPNIVLNCFWDTTSSQQTSSALGTGLDTAAMQNQLTFTDAGWDFVGETDNGFIDDWAIPAGGGYPVLWYQLPTAPPLPTFAGGSGTQADPYQIATIDHLNSIGHNSRLLDKHFRLVKDLDFAGQPFTMIANGSYAFMGTFDGNSHTIRNISISTPICYSNMGFIGGIYSGDVFDVILHNMSLQAEYAQNVGSLVGLNRSGRVENCHSQNVDVLGLWTVGGLVGTNYWHANISGSSVIGRVEESSMLSMLGPGLGGLAGDNAWWSTIDTSSANVDVFGEETLGGLVGSNLIYSEVTDSYAVGTVTATDDRVGGLVGSSNGAYLTRCYAACEITAPAEAMRVGCLAGSLGSGIYTGCFWDNQINGVLPGFGGIRDTTELINTVGETTANMQLAATYQGQGWDFENVWDMRCEGMSYPRLKAKPLLPGDFVCPEGVELNDLVIFYDEWLAEAILLSADMAPEGGDGKVDLTDWAHLANAWMSSTGQAGWDADCDIAPETPDGQINELDLTEFAGQWLYRSARFADIAPASAHDGRVDLLDYSLFSENWLLGTD